MRAGPSSADGAGAPLPSTLTAQGLGPCFNGSRFVIANFNAGSQVVLSGTLAGMEAAAQALQAAGATLTALRVSGAFHSPYMSPAAEAFAEMLAGVEFMQPRVPVIANVNGLPYADRKRTNVRERFRWHVREPLEARRRGRR